MLRPTEPYRFLKQARHLASRRFLNEGERSSLPQYRHISLSSFAAPRADCRGCPIFLVFRSVTCCRPVPVVFFFFEERVGSLARSRSAAIMLSLSPGDACSALFISISNGTSVLARASVPSQAFTDIARLRLEWKWSTTLFSSDVTLVLCGSSRPS